jgi:hypothetical protein
MPVFSKDGTLIAYTVYPATFLFILDAANGNMKYSFSIDPLKTLNLVWNY